MIPEEHEQPNDRGSDMTLIKKVERLLEIANDTIKKVMGVDTKRSIALEQDAHWNYALLHDGKVIVKDLPLEFAHTLLVEHVKKLKLEQLLKPIEELDGKGSIIPSLSEKDGETVVYCISFIFSGSKTMVYIGGNSDVAMTYPQAWKAVKHIMTLAKQAAAQNEMRASKGETFH